jgi:type II secretion system protein G
LLAVSQRSPIEAIVALLQRGEPMPTFQYRALTQADEVFMGTPDTSSLAEVNRRIERLGPIATEAATATSEATSHGERLDKSTGSPARLARRAGRTESREGEAGFTLVEMLVVITIIGLVMALVGPRVLSYLGDSKVKAAKIQIESFSAALDLYHLDNGAYPSASESLTALVQRPSSATAWNGPYLRTGSAPDASGASWSGEELRRRGRIKGGPRRICG